MAQPVEQPLNIYFAGELFTHKDLVGNAILAESISELSDQRYCSVLPQNFEQRGTSPHFIRDQDLLNLIESDLALFCFDGSDLDAGTVVEFMAAKFADIPSVILRTDYRSKSSGDQADFPWNLMASFYPRCEVEVVDSMTIYQSIFKEFPMIDAGDVMIEKRSSDVAHTMLRVVAQAIVDAFDRVLEQPVKLPAASAETVYDWLARFAGFEDGDDRIAERLKQALKRKRERRLLA